MNVGVIHPYFDVIGGAEMTTLSLIEALKKHIEYHTTLYTVTPPVIDETENFKICKIKRKNIPSFWRYQRLMEIKDSFKKSSRDDILLVMSGGLALSKTDVKKIVIYCNSTFSGDKSLLSTNVFGLRGIYASIIKNNVKDSIERLKSDRVELISNSNYTRSKILENFEKDSTVIYPPVRIEKFRQLEKAKKMSVVTVSRFSPEKNLEFAVNIMKSLNIEYHLIGNAIYEKQIRLFNYLKDSTIENTRIHCNIEQSIMDRLVSDAKVYFHASEETFGISVVEAIAAGCIPIVPDNSAHRETVPFKELRYTPYDEKDAQTKVKAALSGDFDGLLEQLQNHVQKFSEDSFQRSFLNHMMN